MSVIFCFVVAIVATFAPFTNGYEWSDKTIHIGYQGISNHSVFLFNDDLVNMVNAKFPGLNLPLGSCLTFNYSLYRLSQGLDFVRQDANDGPQPDPIGLGHGFFVPPGRFVLYNKFFGRHLTNPRGEYGELLTDLGSDPTQPFQLLNYNFGSGELTTNEGITTTAIFVGMGDVLYNTGIFEKFSNGHARINSMTTVDPMNISNGTSFKYECINIVKFDSNGNVFRQDSYAWPYW